MACFNSEKIGERYFISSPAGLWAMISEEEYLSLQKKGETYSRLEKSGVILTEENLPSLREKTKNRYSFLMEPPSLHVVAVTNRCNQDCVYCHARRDNSSMDLKTAKNVADFILSNPGMVATVEFQGGEPLMNFSVVDFLLSYLEENRGDRVLSYRLVSNLSLMTDDILDKLIDYDVKISTSLDGPMALHDIHRGAGSHSKATYWMDRATSMNHRINAMPTITKKSLPYAKEIVDEYVKREQKVLNLRPVSFLGKAACSWEYVGMSPEEYLAFWDSALNHMIGLNHDGADIIDGSALSILERLMGDSCSNMCSRNPCGAGINQLAYDPKGEIFPCDSARCFDDFSLGSAAESSYNQIVKKASHLRGLSNLTTMCDSCAWSPFCNTCVLQSYSLSGSVISKPSEFSCRINQEQFRYVLQKLLGEERDIMLSWSERVRPGKIYSPDI